MVTNSTPTPEPTWTDPNECPFCDEPLEDPGAGFLEHVAESDPCSRGFDAWRGNVADDMVAGWGG